jgi:hypothetical protein
MDIKSLKPKGKIDLWKMRKPFKVLLAILIIIIIALGVYSALDQLGYVKAMKMALQYQKQTALNKEDKAILNKLKKMIVLPEDVTPTMALISDVDALKKQQPGFFANAKNGDRLIIYSDQAIIFDAKAGKIVKVGAVQFTQAQVQPVNFAIYNSTEDAAKTADMEKKLTGTFKNAVVAVKGSAAKTDYPETLVVDLVGNNPEIDKIAEAVGGKVSALPSGEKKPEGAVVLIIIGQK